MRTSKQVNQFDMDAIYEAKRLREDYAYRFEIADTLNERVDQFTDFSDRVRFFMQIASDIKDHPLTLNKGAILLYRSREEESDHFNERATVPFKVIQLYPITDEERRTAVRLYFLEFYFAPTDTL